jgi:hypothetical protein
MVDSIKITALQDIGANIAYTTLVPLVNMAGTPTTQKANLQILGNLILNGAGGSYFPRAAQANLALNVANAAQPNITSVGNLTSLRVTGNITTGNINGGNIVVANFYYGDGGFLTNVAGGGSNYSNSNVAAYLPTYTGNVGAGNVNVTGTVYANGLSSTGLASLTVLTVSTTANLGAVSNITITGGTSGQKLTTNGNGVLSWTNDANSSYGNSDVAAYLPTYTGNVGASNIVSNGNVGITTSASANALTWNFSSQGVLQWPGGIGQIDTNVDVFEIRSTNGLVISTDNANANLRFEFDTDGIFTAPSNVNLLGTRLNIGSDSIEAELVNPTIVISTTGSDYIQAAIINSSSNGSSDWAAYGADADDFQAFADLGFAGHTFNDANFSITSPGDAYVFGQGYANGIGGSLVLATGENGNVPDIVFATGGFTSGTEFARIDHANNVFHLTRANSGIQFADGSIQTTADSRSNISNGNSNVSIATANGNVTISAVGNTTMTVTGTGANITGTLNATGNVTANNFTGNGGGLSNVATKVEGSWTLASGTNTVSISVPGSGTYSLWINGNIPNGIATYTATAVVTNPNVPVLGEQYAWYYEAGNALVITSIPDQFVGTQGAISNTLTYFGNTANVFTFGITNNSGNAAVVNYGYTKL